MLTFRKIYNSFGLFHWIIVILAVVLLIGIKLFAFSHPIDIELDLNSIIEDPNETHTRYKSDIPDWAVDSLKRNDDKDEQNHEMYSDWNHG